MWKPSKRTVNMFLSKPHDEMSRPSTVSLFPVFENSIKKLILMTESIRVLNIHG